MKFGSYPTKATNSEKKKQENSKYDMTKAESNQSCSNKMKLSIVRNNNTVNFNSILFAQFWMFITAITLLL